MMMKSLIIADPIFKNPSEQKPDAAPTTPIAVSVIAAICEGLEVTSSVN
jgi:hypothetical protein